MRTYEIIPNTLQFQQENIDAKHQICRPEIGCKLNKLADLTNIKVTHYPLNSFLPRCCFSQMNTYLNTYLHEPNIYLDIFNALL